MEVEALRDALGIPRNDADPLDEIGEALAGIRLARIEGGAEGGYRIKETATHYIDVMPMLYNWRITTVPIACPMTYDRGWCYQGTGIGGFVPAVLAAIAWDGSDDTEPPGYFKVAGA